MPQDGPDRTALLVSYRSRMVVHVSTQSVAILVSVPQDGPDRTALLVSYRSRMVVYVSTQSVAILVSVPQDGPARTALLVSYLIQNGGACFNTIGSYTCQCAAGWTGQNCSIGKL